jgi:hypothetical protein
METIADTSYNLNNFEFVIKPVQSFSSADNSLLLMGCIALILLVSVIRCELIGYNKYICKLK